MVYPVYLVDQGSQDTYSVGQVSYFVGQRLLQLETNFNFPKLELERSRPLAIFSNQLGWYFGV